MTEEIEKLCAQRDEFWAKALNYAMKSRLDKASKMAWQAIVRALEILGVSQGVYLDTFQKIVNFSRDLSRATGDPYFKTEFRDLYVLYGNAYDGILDETDFPEYLARAGRFIRRLAEKLPKLSAESRLRVICADCREPVQLLGSEGITDGGWVADVDLYCPKCRKTWKLFHKEEGSPAKFDL